MPYLSPQTLTQAEQRLILRSTCKHPRDHLIISLALGTGLRLGEIVGLNVGDVFTPDGTPRVRVRVRREIAHFISEFAEARQPPLDNHLAGPAVVFGV